MLCRRCPPARTYSCRCREWSSETGPDTRRWCTGPQLKRLEGLPDSKCSCRCLGKIFVKHHPRSQPSLRSVLQKDGGVIVAITMAPVHRTSCRVLP